MLDDPFAKQDEGAQVGDQAVHVVRWQLRIQMQTKAIEHRITGATRLHGPQDLALLRDQPWVVNSRGTDDDELASRLCTRAGFTPRVVHRADSLELVQAIVAAGLGVALLPSFVPALPEVRFVPLTGAGASRRMWTATRPGHEDWPPVALVARLVTEHARDEVVALGGSVVDG